MRTAESGFRRMRNVKALPQQADLELAARAGDARSSSRRSSAPLSEIVLTCAICQMKLYIMHTGSHLTRMSSSVSPRPKRATSPPLRPQAPGIRVLFCPITRKRARSSEYDRVSTVLDDSPARLVRISMSRGSRPVLGRWSRTRALWNCTDFLTRSLLSGISLCRERAPVGERASGCTLQESNPRK